MSTVAKNTATRRTPQGACSVCKKPKGRFGTVCCSSCQLHFHISCSGAPALEGARLLRLLKDDQNPAWQCAQCQAMTLPAPFAKSTRISRTPPRATFTTSMPSPSFTDNTSKMACSGIDTAYGKVSGETAPNQGTSHSSDTERSSLSGGCRSAGSTEQSPLAVTCQNDRETGKPVNKCDEKQQCSNAVDTPFETPTRSRRRVPFRLGSSFLSTRNKSMLWDYGACGLLDSVKLDDTHQRADGQDILDLDPALEPVGCPRCADLETWSQSFLVDPMNAIRAELTEHREILERMEQIIRQTHAKQLLLTKQLEEQANQPSKSANVSVSADSPQQFDELSKYDGSATVAVVTGSALTERAEELPAVNRPLKPKNALSASISSEKTRRAVLVAGSGGVARLKRQVMAIIGREPRIHFYSLGKAPLSAVVEGTLLQMKKHIKRGGTLVLFYIGPDYFINPGVSGGGAKCDVDDIWLELEASINTLIASAQYYGASLAVCSIPGTAGFERECAVINGRLVSKLEGTHVGFLDLGDTNNRQGHIQANVMQNPNQQPLPTARVIAQESSTYLRSSVVQGNVRSTNVGGKSWLIRSPKSSRSASVLENRFPFGRRLRPRRLVVQAAPTTSPASSYSKNCRRLPHPPPEATGPTFSRAPPPLSPFHRATPSNCSYSTYELAHPSQTCHAHKPQQGTPHSSAMAETAGSTYDERNRPTKPTQKCRPRQTHIRSRRIRPLNPWMPGLTSHLQ